MAESCCLTRVCSGQKAQMILFKCIIHLVISLLDFISAPCAAQMSAALHGRAIFSNKVIFIWVYMSFALMIYDTSFNAKQTDIFSFCQPREPTFSVIPLP